MSGVSEAQARAMVATMAELQDQYNSQVHPEWRNQGYAYYRAIWVECAEMLDHYGWKWWKKQAPDADQVKLELVDIWHFALSELIRADTLTDQVASDLNALELSDGGDSEEFRLAIEALAASSLETQSFELSPFLRAMAALPMGLEEIFHLYIGKNVLNGFRQDHGYKEGTYQKVWAGREDNEHLVEILSALESAPEEIAEDLYAALEQRYPD